MHDSLLDWNRLAAGFVVVNIDTTYVCSLITELRISRVILDNIVFTLPEF